MKLLKEILNSFTDALFPCYGCVFCGQEVLDTTFGICEKCKVNIPKITGNVCLKCGMPMEHHGSYCVHCKGNEFNFDYARAFALFDSTTIRAVYNLKYENGKYVAEKFGRMLAEVYAGLNIDNAIVVPVPLHVNRMKDRGYNQSEEIAKVFTKLCDLKIDTTSCVREKETPTQTELTRKEREVNLEGAFGLTDKKNLFNKNVIIIDDVFTTGATVNALAKIIRKAKPLSIVVLTILKVKPEHKKAQNVHK